jgi:triacylglycerol lipase
MTTKRKLILVHGITDTSKDMEAIANYLRAKAFHVKTIDFVPNDGSVSLRTSAEQLDAFIRGVADDKIIDIVAFSMGGLIALTWMLLMEGASRTLHYVPISAPLKGTYAAHLMNSPGIRDMRPNSTLIDTLGKRLDQLKNVHITTIRTQFDGIVFPSETSKLDLQGVDNFVVPVLLHRWMLFDTRVHALIEQGLRKSEVS